MSDKMDRMESRDEYIIEKSNNANPRNGERNSTSKVDISDKNAKSGTLCICHAKICCCKRWSLMQTGHAYSRGHVG